MERRKPRSRGVRVAAAVAAAAVVATTVGATAFIGGDDEDSRDDAELTGDAKELADLLERRETAVYHATYEGTGPEGASLEVESWQDAPRARQDQRVSNGGDELSLSTFVLPSGRVTCIELAEQGWSCRQTAAADQATIDPLEAIRARIGEGEVTAEDARVEGRAVRCYRFEVDRERNELCLIPESGIPVRIRGGDSELRLTALEEDVAEEAFTLPAEVTAAS